MNDAAPPGLITNPGSVSVTPGTATGQTAVDGPGIIFVMSVIAGLAEGRTGPGLAFNQQVAAQGLSSGQAFTTPTGNIAFSPIAPTPDQLSSRLGELLTASARSSAGNSSTAGGYTPAGNIQSFLAASGQNQAAAAGPLTPGGGQATVQGQATLAFANSAVQTGIQENSAAFSASAVALSGQPAPTLAAPTTLAALPAPTSPPGNQSTGLAQLAQANPAPISINPTLGNPTSANPSAANPASTSPASVTPAVTPFAQGQTGPALSPVIGGQIAHPVISQPSANPAPPVGAGVQSETVQMPAIQTAGTQTSPGLSPLLSGQAEASSLAGHAATQHSAQPQSMAPPQAAHQAPQVSANAGEMPMHAHGPGISAGAQAIGATPDALVAALVLPYGAGHLPEHILDDRSGRSSRDDASHAVDEAGDDVLEGSAKFVIELPDGIYAVDNHDGMTIGVQDKNGSAVIVDVTENGQIRGIALRRMIKEVRVGVQLLRELSFDLRMRVLGERLIEQNWPEAVPDYLRRAKFRFDGIMPITDPNGHLRGFADHDLKSRKAGLTIAPTLERRGDSSQATIRGFSIILAKNGTHGPECLWQGFDLDGGPVSTTVQRAAIEEQVAALDDGRPGEGEAMVDFFDARDIESGNAATYEDRRDTDL